MMTNIIDLISQFIKFTVVRTEVGDEENLPISPRSRFEWLWPRFLLFNVSGNDCEDEDEDAPAASTEICIEVEESSDDESCDDAPGSQNQQESACSCPAVGGLRQKLGCIYRNAKFGLREGALTGVFLGGCLGIYKYVDAVYIKGESSGGGGGSEGDGESTVNDNVIFVTAANGAIAMAVFCTLLCCSRGIIYC